MNIALQIDSAGYDHKPQGAEIATIKTRLASLQPVTIPLQEIARRIVSGCSFTPAVLIGGAKAENWNSQQLFCIDLDNEDKSVKGKHDKRRAENPLTLEQVNDRCTSERIKPALVYETFSSSEDWQRLRVVFVAPYAITDRKQAENIQRALMELFPECDGACKNADRLFFGGKKVLQLLEDAVLTVENLGELESLGNFLTLPAPPVPKPEKDKQLEQLKRDFDFLGYIRGLGGSEKAMHDRILFNPCPICGHNDDFLYYPATNSFYCYGAGGNCGGSVIDFIMRVKNFDRKGAIEHFKYEMCNISRTKDKAEYRKSEMIKRHNINAPAAEFTDELPPYIYEDVDRNGVIVYKVSCQLLAEYIRQHCNYFFLNSNGNGSTLKFWYYGGVYKLISDGELKGIIKRFISDYDLTLLHMKDVDEVYKDLTTDQNFKSIEDLNADENIINFENGILHLDTMELQPHSPEILSTIQIPCKWNPFTAGSPVFEGYLHKLTNGNEEIKRFLLQFMGAAISNYYGYRFKKALFMVGVGDTGKSQLKALTEKLIGENNCSPCNIRDLEERFGTGLLFGKRVIGSADMSFLTVRELKTFKNITGGDCVGVEFKGRDAFQYKYKGLVWFCMNELPRFGGDRGDHVYNRIAVVRCDNVIPPEQQDKQLLEKMYAEREAVVLQAVLAFREAVQNGGRFSLPEVCSEEIKAYKVENSPVLSFFEECCCERKTQKLDSCTCSKTHEVFKAWCRDNGGYIPTKREFRQELANKLINGDIKALERKSDGNRYYTFTLTAEAKREYVSQYGFDTPT